MILNEIKKELIYSKNITLTSKYIILYKGSSVTIYNHQFSCQKKFLNLKYVYNGYVSPDETKLLLVSNSNRFYIVLLDELTLISTRSIKSPYNGNLEGVACWCSDNTFILPVQNSASMLSTLRKYNCDSSVMFQNYLEEIFSIKYITFIKQKNEYLILGFNRTDNCWNIIWLDMFMRYTTFKILEFDEAIFDVEVCSDTERIILTGESKIYSCDFQGIPSDIKGYQIPENITFHGLPVFFKLSKNDSSIAYFGTTNSLIVYDLKKQNTIRSYHMEYGARAVEEFGEYLFVSSYDGLKLLSLNE